MLVLLCCMRRGSTVVKQLLQEDIARHKEKVQSLSDSADAFARQNHFMASELLDRAKRIAERYIFLSPKISSSCWIITTFASPKSDCLNIISGHRKFVSFWAPPLVWGAVNSQKFCSPWLVNMQHFYWYFCVSIIAIRKFIELPTDIWHADRRKIHNYTHCQFAVFAISWP